MTPLIINRVWSGFCRLPDCFFEFRHSRKLGSKLGPCIIYHGINLFQTLSPAEVYRETESFWGNWIQALEEQA